MKFRRTFFVQLLVKTKTKHVGGQTSTWRSDLLKFLSITSLILVPKFVSAQIIISEIMYDAPGSDAKAEWVELQNTDADAVDVSKWKINDGSNHVLNAPPKNGSTGSLIVPPGGYVILAANAETFLSTHSVVVSVIDTVLDLGNDSGKISLLDATTTVEKVSYSTSKGGNGTGESLQLVNGKWTHAKPTPGVANSSERIAKIAPPPAPTNTSTKKIAAATKTQAQDVSPAVSTEVTDFSEAAPAAQVASAVVPLQTSHHSFVPYIFGALAVGVAGAGAVVVSRKKKAGEWDIEEIA